MGTSPIEYLTGWRMLVAADTLISCNDSVAGIALSVGYESESTFGAAFKKIMG
jgi:transcriptional regulator GlxA family with amidase domain